MANENLLPEFENPKEENLLPEFEIKRKGALEKAIEPITSIPETYQKMVRGSVEQMGRGIEQISGALEQPTIPSGAWEAAKGIGNIALGGLGYVTAPISTPFHTIVGEPIRENVEPYVGPEAAQVIGATAEGLAGLAIPTKVPQFRTAPRLPPEEPFGITRTLGERTDNIGMRAEEAAAIRSGEPYAAEFAAQRQAQIDAAREGMIRQLDPYEQQIIALTPREAGELASRGIIGEATQARTNVNSLYTTAKNLPGEIHAGAFEGIGQKIKGDISLGDSPVIIDNTTPQAAKMINYLDDQISNLKIKNVADPFGAPSAENIVGVNLKGVDQWRRNLSAMRRDAFSSSPPGQISGDARAAQAVLDAFDERIASTINNPAIFTGDSRAVDAWNQARQAYADYRRTFTAQRNDPAGRAMQRIIGDPINDPLTPSKVIDSIIGATGVSASPTNIAVASRVRSVLGEGSPEWIAVKQTLLQRLIRPGEGEVDFGISRQAQNLSKFLNGDMARVMYTPAEQSMLRGYANLMRDLTLPTGTYAPSEPAIRRLQGALTQRIGGLVGSIIGHKIVPVPVVGELAGYAAGKQAEKLIAPTLKKNFPIISQEMRKWSEAQSRAMTQPQNTMAQRAAVSATINLQRALNPLGIKIDELVEPKKEESLLSTGGSVLDKMHAAKRRKDGGPLDGPFDEAGVQHTAEGYPYIQAGDVVEAPETVAAPAPAPEEPRPGYLQKSIEGLTRGVRELPGTVARAAEDYWAKTKEEQKHGLEMAERGLSNIAGGLPATGVGEVGLGALQYLASPITGVQKPIEKATGSPEFAERLMAIPLGPESLAAKTGIAMAGAGIGAKGVLGAMQAAKAERELTPFSVEVKPVFESFNDTPKPLEMKEGIIGEITKSIDQSSGDIAKLPTTMGLGPMYVVDSGVEPVGKGFLLASTNNKNAAKQIDGISPLISKYPDMATNPEQWAKAMTEATGNTNVVAPPYRFAKAIKNGEYENLLKSLTEGQIKDRTIGFENGKKFLNAYTSGQMDVADTGKLFMWGILSRGVDPFTHEGLFLDAFNGIEPWVRMSAEGRFTKEIAEGPYKEWAATTSPKGSGQAGSGAMHNLNAFGRDFLVKMGTPGENGITPIQRLHDLMSNPELSGRDIRREFAKTGEGVGIDNKVVSFILLATGRDDVMVIDRIQLKNLWDDGRYGDFNIWDGISVPVVKTKDGKVKRFPPTPDGREAARNFSQKNAGSKIENAAVTGSSLAEATYGAKGILIYEAIEDAIMRNVKDLYAKAGIPGVPTPGMFHWDTWVARSNQEASHGTLGSILAKRQGVEDPLSGIYSKQGDYQTYAYGAKYAVSPGGPHYKYPLSTGEEVRLSPSQLSEVLEKVKNPKYGVVPKGFKVSETTGAPWYERKEVNRAKLDELLREASSGQISSVLRAFGGQISNGSRSSRGGSKIERRERGGLTVNSGSILHKMMEARRGQR